ncbi:MAG: GNAT family N-acetyltransferase [Pseudomonadota bacterium]
MNQSLSISTKRLHLKPMTKMPPHFYDQARSIYESLKIAELNGVPLGEDRLISKINDSTTNIHQAKKGTRLIWSIEKDEDLIGVVDISHGAQSSVYRSGYAKKDERWASIGCHFEEKSWGQGYGQEVLTALIEFGFESLELDGFLEETLSTNTKALGLLRALQFEELEWEDPLWPQFRRFILSREKFLETHKK